MGNLGDELIYAGTRQLLAGLRYREQSILDLQNLTGHTALFAGSGAWCRPFHAMPPFLPAVEERFQTVIVLPSSFDTSEETVADALKRTRALVFARELESYRQIQSLCRADIAHDCAFYFDYEKYKRKGTGVLNAFRTDAEARHEPLPEDNIDISAVCSSLDEWLSTVAKYDVVRTDRGACDDCGGDARQARPVQEVQLSQGAGDRPLCLAGISRGSPSRGPPAAARREPARGPPVRIAFCSLSRGTRRRAHVVLVNEAASLRFCGEYSKDDLILVRNAIPALQRCPELIEPLRSLCGTVQRVILADDIDSFPDATLVEAFLQRHGLPVEFFGYASRMNKKIATVALLSASKPPLPIETPEGFRVIALVSSFNEEDVIVPTIEQLYRGGIDVYLIDNWSTDDTYERAHSLLGRGLVGLERFPPEGPAATYDWERLLQRKEELGRELKADWFIHHDADEIHESPWQSVRLRDAIYWVDRQGYNAIDFTLLDFPPVDDAYQAGSSLAGHFRYCEFSTQKAAFGLVRAWKAADGAPILSQSGGHSAEFPGRKLYPYKFLLRHYPIRSQAHGEKKLFHERKCRWMPVERRRGWHVHYDLFVPGSRFLRNPKTLIELNADFYSNYLLERLCGIGIIPQETATIESLQSRAAEREQVVRTLSGQVQTLSAEVQTLSAQAQAASAQLAAITASRAWKMALVFRRVRLRLVPPDSHRARLLRRLKQMLRRPDLRP